MKLVASPRQPLPGAALAALSGILLAEIFSAPIGLVCVFLALTAVVSLVRPALWRTELLVLTAFFALHLVQQTDAPGKELQARLGERARAVEVSGMVVSEPKISPNDFTTFLLRLDSIDLGGRREASDATVRLRWKGNPQFGDEIRLHGLAETIPAARTKKISRLIMVVILATGRWSVCDLGYATAGARR